MNPGDPAPQMLPRVRRGSGGLQFAGGGCPRWLPFDQTRPATPVVLPDGTATLLVTRYDEAAEVFTAVQASRAHFDANQRLRGPGMRMSMASMDPPEHRPARTLASGAFSARQIAQLIPGIQRTAQRLIDTMRRHGGPADLISQFCRPLAFAAHFDVLGVPAVHRHPLSVWSSRRSSRPGITAAEVFSAEQRLHTCVERLVDDPGASSGGLMTQLAQRRQHGTLTRSQVSGVITSLLFDGPVLAGTQLANALLGLLTHPDQLELLREDPRLDAGAAEELLRYLPTANTSLSRVTTDAVAIGPSLVPAGTVVTVALPLVNRDGARFPQPERLDVTRRGTAHLTFGRGVHYCLGAHLMRVLLGVTFAKLLRLLPGLRLAVPEKDLVWFDSANIRGSAALPVRW